MRTCNLSFLRHLSVYLLFAVCTSSLSQAQILYNETFDFDPIGFTTGWTTASLQDNGPSPAPGQALWTLTPNGRADMGAYWDGRDSIDSPTSSTGAALFNSDFLDNNGLVGNSCGPGATSCAPHEGVLISPKFSFPTAGPIGVQFFQYFRGFHTRTFLEVSTDSMNWVPFEVNQEHAPKPFGGETSTRDFQLINITPLASGQPEFWIRFRFEGEYYFWLIDDLQLVVMPIEDLTVTEVVWPKRDQICILGPEEQVQIRVHNYGLTPRTNFRVHFSLDGFTYVTDTFPGLLDPNHSVVVTFDSIVDLTNFFYMEAHVDSFTDNNISNNIFYPEYRDCPKGVDTLGGVYIYRHGIVLYPPGTSENEKDSVRDEFKAIPIKVCSCDSIELWDLSYPIERLTDTIFSPEQWVPRAGAHTKIKDAGLNYLVDLKVDQAPPATPSFIAPKDSVADDTVIVAIPDTGFDFLHDSVTYFWENAAELADPYGADDGGNCQIQDNWGYNFIDEGEVPFDDQSHGTHVGGIINNFLPHCLRVELMVMKVMAQNGRGSLYETLCGMKYAINEGADLINFSMGYSGNPSALLDSMIGQAADSNMLVIASGGNEGTNNDSLPHWPSNFNQSHPNVIAVGPVDDSDNYPPFANTGVNTIDIAAPGVDILSMIPGPGGPMEEKTGSSMAAAFVSRTAAFYIAQQPQATFREVKDFILSTADSLPELVGKVAGARRLNLNDSIFYNIGCTTVAIEDPLLMEVMSYPNPFSNQVNLSFVSLDNQELELRVFNSMGQLIHQERKRVGTGHCQFSWEAKELPHGIYHFQLLKRENLLTSGKWLKY